MLYFERRLPVGGTCPGPPAAAWLARPATPPARGSATTTRAVSLPLQAHSHNDGLTLGWDRVQAGGMSWSPLQAVGPDERPQRNLQAFSKTEQQAGAHPGSSDSNRHRDAAGSSSSIGDGWDGSHASIQQQQQQQQQRRPRGRSRSERRSANRSRRRAESMHRNKDAGAVSGSTAGSVPQQARGQDRLHLEETALTSQLALAPSIPQLMSLVSAHNSALNLLHVTAALARLAALDGSGSQGARQQARARTGAGAPAKAGAAARSRAAAGAGAGATSSVGQQGLGPGRPLGANGYHNLTAGGMERVPAPVPLSLEAGGSLAAAAHAAEAAGDTEAGERLRSSLSASTSAPGPTTHTAHTQAAADIHGASYRPTSSPLTASFSSLSSSPFSSLPSAGPVSLASLNPSTAAAASTLVALLLPLLRSCACPDRQSSCVSSALHSLARIGYRSSAALHQLMDVAAGVMPTIVSRPRHLARMMLSLAKLNCRPQAAWLDLVMREMMNSKLLMGRLVADGSAGTNNGTGSISSGSGGSSSAIPGCSAWSIAGGLGAGATEAVGLHRPGFGAGGDDPAASGHRHEGPVTQGSDAAAGARHVGASPFNTAPNAHPQETATCGAVVLWSLGVMHARPSPQWSQAAAAEVLRRLKWLSAKEGVLVLWGLAKIGAQPSNAQVSQLVDHCLQDLPSLGLRELYPLMEGCVVLRHWLWSAKLELVLSRVQQCVRSGEGRHVSAGDVAGMMRASALLLKHTLTPYSSGGGARRSPEAAAARRVGQARWLTGTRGKVMSAEEYTAWLRTRFFPGLVQVLLPDSSHRHRNLGAGDKRAGLPSGISQLSLGATATGTATDSHLRALATNDTGSAGGGDASEDLHQEMRMSSSAAYQPANLRQLVHLQTATAQHNTLAASRQGLGTDVHTGVSDINARRRMAAANVLPLPSAFSTQELVQTLWACAKMGTAPPERWLHAALVSFAAKPGLSEDEGKGKGHNSGAASAAAAAGAGQTASGSRKCSAAVGTSSISGGSGGSVGAGAGAGRSRLDSAGPQDLSLLLYSLAKLQRHPPSQTWYRALLWASASKLSAFSPQNLANMVWAMAQLQLPPDLGWSLLWVRAVRRKSIPAFNWVELCQLRQALATLMGLQLQSGTEDGRGGKAARNAGPSTQVQAHGRVPQQPQTVSTAQAGASGVGAEACLIPEWVLLLPSLPRHPELLTLLRDVAREVDRRSDRQGATPAARGGAVGTNQR